MSSTKLSILGIEKYLNFRNDTLFDFNVPEGIDIDTLKNNIILKSADFECLYPDPNFLKLAIEHWSKKHYRTFSKWITALNIEYSPLENYDRIEEWTDQSTDTGKVLSTDSTNTTNHNTGTASTDKSAYNSDSYSPVDRVSNESDALVNSSGNSTSESKQSSETNKRGRAHGNIGVTTSQQMLKEELDIATWNIYENITDLFLQEFCLMVY